MPGSQTSWKRTASVAAKSITLALCAASLAACAVSDMKPGAKSIFQVFTPPTPEEAARWSVDKYDADKRFRGTLLLANATFANEPVYLQLFSDNSKDEDPGVRVAATRGLANHGSPEQIQLIIDRLKDEDVSVRIEAARALQRVHSDLAINPLLDTIDPEKEADAAVRAEAAAALGQYPRPTVIEKLITILDDDNLAINRNTRSSLRTMTGQDFGYDRGAWARWNKDTKSTFAAGSVYMYPVFSRDKAWYEYIPFVPGPPNEVSSTPAGLQPTAQ